MSDPSPIGDCIEDAIEDWFNKASLTDLIRWDISAASASKNNKVLLTKINARIDQLTREKKENNGH